MKKNINKVDEVNEILNIINNGKTAIIHLTDDNYNNRTVKTYNISVKQIGNHWFELKMKVNWLNNIYKIIRNI